MAAVLKRAAILPLIGVASVASAVDTLPVSGELACDDLRLERCEFFDPASGLSVRLPWRQHGLGSHPAFLRPHRNLIRRPNQTFL